MKKFVSLCLGIFLAVQAVPAKANEAVLVYEESVLPGIEMDIVRGNFQEAVISLKHILTDDSLTDHEKIYLLKKSYLAAKNMGYFLEAGEILELSYIMNELDADVRKDVHTELTRFYKNIRSWNKCIQTHFYYFQNVKVDNEEKIAVFFDIVQNYQYLMQYKKAEHVLGEILQICSTDRDFAYVYYYQALGCVSLNEYEKAIKLFEKALQYKQLSEEEQGLALYRTGFCYEILQEPQKAAEYYQKAMPLYKNPFVIKKRLEKLQTE